MKHSIWGYVFNIILAIVFLFLAGWNATKCGGEFNEDFVDTIMWLVVAAWDICIIFFMQNQDKCDYLEDIKKNQEKIIEELERFHNIDVVFKDK